MQAAHISAIRREAVELPLSPGYQVFDVRETTPFPKRK
jgi:hypothetical protein